MLETKYKQTEIGLIPEDWEVMSLSILGNVKMCKRIMKYQTSEVGDIPFFKIGTFGKTPDSFISRELYEKYRLKYPFPRKGAILISAAGTIGRTVIFDGGDAYFQDSNIVWIENDESVVLDKYLYYYYDVIQWKTENGGIVTRLYNDNLKSTCFVCPKDKLEQSRIAEALSDIDKLIASLSKMIEKKRLMKQGTMQQLLTGKKRLPGFEGEWKELLLGNYANVLRGGSPRPIESYLTNHPDGINWIKIGDVSPNARYIDHTEEKIIAEGKIHSREVHKGDFILSNSMSYGRPYILMIDGCIHDGWLVIKDYKDTFDMNYLYYALCSEAVLKQYISMAAGSSVKNLNKEKVLSLIIPTPLDIQEQSAIANVLTTMDNEIESLEEERDKYIRVKEGMMQKLLTGQIRLVETEAKVVAMPKAKGANVHFKRSVLAAEIANRLCEEPTFGHVKMEKLIFLTEHLCHIDTGSHYHRDAAGPYDNTALRSIDKQMKQHQWFALTKKDKGYRYQPMDKRGDHKKYFDKYYAAVLPMFDKVIETFKTSSTEQCEIVATLYSAWEDLQHRNQPFTDDDILNEVLNHWHESKKRIPRSRWQKALDWMRKNGFVPTLDDNN